MFDSELRVDWHQKKTKARANTETEVNELVGGGLGWGIGVSRMFWEDKVFLLRMS